MMTNEGRDVTKVPLWGRDQNWLALWLELLGCYQSALVGARSESLPCWRDEVSGNLLSDVFEIDAGGLDAEAPGDEGAEEASADE
jgi:hypothetical protein